MLSVRIGEIGMHVSEKSLKRLLKKEEKVQFFVTTENAGLKRLKWQVKKDRLKAGRTKWQTLADDQYDLDLKKI